MPPERLSFEATLYVARAGIPLRDPPGEFGARDAVYRRSRRWVGSGARARPFEAMTADQQSGEIRRLLVDPTDVSANRHTAGAARRGKHLGAAEPARRPGLGSRRGGLTSEVVVTAADESTAIAVDVRPGQAHDAPCWSRCRSGPPPGSKMWIRSSAIRRSMGRRACAAIGAEAVIPAKSNRVAPEPLDRVAYRERDRVERLFAERKGFRRVATRYEELKQTFLGMIPLALGFMRLRAKTTSTEPGRCSSSAAMSPRPRASGH